MVLLGLPQPLNGLEHGALLIGSMALPPGVIESIEAVERLPPPCCLNQVLAVFVEITQKGQDFTHAANPKRLW